MTGLRTADCRLRTERLPVPGGSPAPAGSSGGLGGAGHVAGLRTLGTVDDFKLNRLSLFEGTETGALNRRVVYEHVAAAFALDETVALGVVEPLDLACNTHRSLPVLLVARSHRAELPQTHRWMSLGQQK